MNRAEADATLAVWAECRVTAQNVSALVAAARWYQAECARLEALLRADVVALAASVDKIRDLEQRLPNQVEPTAPSEPTAAAKALGLVEPAPTVTPEPTPRIRSWWRAYGIGAAT